MLRNLLCLICLIFFSISTQIFAYEDFKGFDETKFSIVMDYKKFPILIARMSDDLKKQPMATEDSVGGSSTCMNQFRTFYERTKSRQPATLPENTSPACENCLRDRAYAGRPFSDAIRYCRDRCCP